MKRLQVMIKDETFQKIEVLVAKCNEDFTEGTVRVQDVVEWMLSNGSCDVQKVRSRCININKIIKQAKIRTREDLDEFTRKIGLARNLFGDKGAS